MNGVQTMKIFSILSKIEQLVADSPKPRFNNGASRRIDLEFKITNDIDAELVKRVLLTAARETEGVLAEPAPFARMGAVDDDTYIFYVRTWCETRKYWDVYFDLIENCSKALTENDIDDPEERIAVRIVKDED